jgi:hypothetical protein
LAAIAMNSTERCSDEIEPGEADVCESFLAMEVRHTRQKIALEKMQRKRAMRIGGLMTVGFAEKRGAFMLPRTHNC